ncbi:MAG: ATP-binding protein [Tenericutes bacterium]|nr:ATP-binding protein [Mycoplasmatota bacterium]
MQFIYLMGVVLIYLVVLIVSYFSKSHLKTKENKYYSILLIINFIGLLLEILCGILGNKLPDDTMICHFFTKLFMCFMTYFTLTLTIYIYSLCFEKNENVFNRIKNLTCIVGMLSTFIIFVLPITTGNGFATGLSCDYTYNVGTVAITASIITIFCHIKTVKMKKVLPFLAFTLFNIIIVFIQRINPTVTLTTSMESIVLFIMYFTIENPDLKIIEELTKTQAMTEASNAEKNKFIFSITNDIQDKIDKLDKLYLEMSNCNSLEIINEDLVKSKNIIDTARNKIRNTIDVSSLDVRNLNEVKNKYNPKLLFNSIYYNYKNKLDKNIDFRIIMEDNIPNELYGDSIRVKQIVSTLLGNAFKYTKDGYVEFRINSIIKSNICRLIIVVEDSGCGIDVFKQKEIMSNHEDMTNAEIINKDNLELNLKLVRKIINIIGGTFIIESGSTKGAKITVTLNQEIVTSNNDTIENKYKDYYNDIKNIGVISSNEKNVRVVKSIGKKNGDVVESFDMTKTCLDKIRNGESFNIIVIDEDMDKIDARSFLDKVRQVDGFKGKVFVITKNKSINLKKELKEYGFDAVLINPLNKKDIEDNFK